MLGNGAKYDTPVCRKQTATHTIPENRRLVEYFLLHEVGETAFVQHSYVQVYLFGMDIYFFCIQGGDMEFLSPAAAYDLLVIEINDFVGVTGYWRSITCDEEFTVVFAKAYGKRAALSGGNNGIGLLLVNDCNCVCANDFLEGDTDCGSQVDAMLLLSVLDELKEDFCVRFALEGESALLQLVPEDGSIFNDSVMDHSEVPALGQVGMGIDFVGGAMRCPAGVGYANGAGTVMSLGCLLKVGDFANCFIYIELSCIVKDGRTG